MSAPASTPSQAAEVFAPAAEDRDPTSEIDASLRWPLLAMVASAALWLLAGSTLSILTAIKLHGPGFLGDFQWLTLGRVRPAATNCLLYGFASQASFAVILWLLSRLGGNRFNCAIPALIATKLWNIGVTVGVIAILAGASTGFEWLEMPRYAAGLLFAAYAVFGVTAVLTFQGRRVTELYPSQWFLLAAVFWFPWTYLAANYLLVAAPVRGTMQAVVNGWFTGNFATLWLMPVALAALYYFLPRLANKPLHSSGLAAFAFWTLLGFAGFSGLTGLIGAPVPRWMPAFSTAATVCLLLPLLCNVLNWHLTLCADCKQCDCSAWKDNAPLSFMMLGVLGYILSGLFNALTALPHVAEVINLTYVNAARQALFLHGFIGAVLIGAIYHLLPAIAGSPWPNRKLLHVHWYLTVAGVALVVLGLGIAGWMQGRRLADPSVAFLDVVKGTAPLMGISTLGLTLLFCGQLVFAVNVVRMLRAVCETVCRPLCAAVCGCAPTANAGVKS